MEKYEWLEVLGRGSFGVASLVRAKGASHGQAPLRVAKEVDLSAATTKARRATQNEVNVLRSLSHANIVAYYESFVQEEVLYIIMEYADGGDLAAAIRQRRQLGHRFGQEFALSTLAQCARALRHIHARHIVHRDVKSPNVFLTKAGGVKLGDFGIARVLDNTGALALTAIGTPSHLSPEVCHGEPYGTKADIWSFGVVMFEVLALEPPFQAENILALVARITGGEPKRVSPEPYHEDVWALVRRTLQKDPADRPCAGTVLAAPVLRRACAQPAAAGAAGDALDGLLRGRVEAEADGAALEATLRPQAPAVTPPWARKRGVRPPPHIEVESRDSLDELLQYGGARGSKAHSSGSLGRRPQSSSAPIRSPAALATDLGKPQDGLCFPRSVHRRTRTPQQPPQQQPSQPAQPAKPRAEEQLTVSDKILGPLSVRGVSLGVAPRPRAARGAGGCCEEPPPPAARPVLQAPYAVAMPVSGGADLPRLLGRRREAAFVSPTAGKKVHSQRDAVLRPSLA